MADLFNFDDRLSSIEIISRDTRLASRPLPIENLRIEKFSDTVSHINSTVTHIGNDIRDIKSDIKELRKADETNFRVTFAAIIATATGLAGLMASGFGWL